MESLDAYLRRKGRELTLIESFLPNPVSSPQLGSVDDVVARKFQAGAALKAAQVCADWQLTETHWTRKSDFRIGPFTVTYNYQRADLAIHSPAIYSAPRWDVGHTTVWSAFTSCGMAAVASLAAAYGQVCPDGAWLLPPHGYPETQELVSLYGRRFGFIPFVANSGSWAPEPGRQGAFALFIDSGAAVSVAPPAPATLANVDLILLDTTCFARSSGRIAAIMHNAGIAGAPVVLLRSHTKLDSLGIEYGRLGSLVITVPQTASVPGRHMAERLAAAIDTSMRLFGAAALPEHLPPFAAGDEWNALCRLRTARIVRNNRWAARTLAARACSAERTCLYRHGLFFTLAPGGNWNETEARGMAKSLVEYLHSARLPIRHAGSFGFDFAVADAFPAIDSDNFVLRIGFGDLPDELVRTMVDEIGIWTASKTAGAGNASFCS